MYGALLNLVISCPAAKDLSILLGTPRPIARTELKSVEPTGTAFPSSSETLSETPSSVPTP
jgi:hypothetical protein